MSQTETRFRLRFGLRAVLLAVFVAALALAYVSSVREQREAIRSARVSNPSLTLLYAYQLDAAGHLNHDGQPSGPEWLRERAGIDALSSIAGADMFYPTDADMRELARFSNLRRLVMERSIDLTNAGMKSIGGMKRLEYLVLGEAEQVSDAGLLELARLKWLKELRMDQGREMTAEGIEALKERMPWCCIQVRKSPDEGA